MAQGGQREDSPWPWQRARACRSSICRPSAAAWAGGSRRRSPPCWPTASSSWGPRSRGWSRRSPSTPACAHAISCASGTDALLLVLMARGIGPGDAVFVPAFTFAASAEAVALGGATPVFVDVEPDELQSRPGEPRATRSRRSRRAGVLTPRAVIAVDLFGRPADYERAAAGRPRAAAVPAAGCGAELRRPLAGRARRPPGRCRGDQLLSGQAARRLWRWRRGADRRRRAGRGGAAAAAAWRAPRQRALRAPADRPQQPARHAPGGDPAGQARGARGGDRAPGGARRALRRGARRASRCGRRTARRPLGLGAVHDPGRRRATGWRAALAPARHPDRDPLPAAAAPQPAYRHFPTAPGGLPVAEALARDAC